MRAHLSINVNSIDASIAFYRKVFGVEPQKRTNSYAKFDLKEPALNFSMLATGEERLPSRVNHLGIEVSSAEDVITWKKRLEAQGIETVSEEGTDCCYALQDKIWFDDPDGNSWEVFFVHAQLPVEAAEPPKKKALGFSESSCC